MARTRAIDPRTEILNFRVTPAERKAIEAEAARLGIKPGKLIRERVLGRTIGPPELLKPRVRNKVARIGSEVIDPTERWVRERAADLQVYEGHSKRSALLAAKAEWRQRNS